MRIIRLGVVTGALLLASACGSSSPGAAPQVPTLSTGTPVQTTAAGAPVTEDASVEIRLDSTNEEVEALWQQYHDCLVKNGAVKQENNDRPAPIGAGFDDEAPATKAAYEACKNRRPWGPKELDPNYNPDFAAQWEDNVRCLRGKGLMVHSTEPGSWTYDSDDTVVPENMAELESACMVEAFGG